jgi:hypothetical protein
MVHINGHGILEGLKLLGTILTHSGWDVMLDKLRLSSCQTNHLHVFLGGVQKLLN